MIVLRENYIKRTRQAILMRFAPDNREPIQQGTLSGDPDCFALRADGSRLAVAMHDGTLHILDDDFRVLQSGRLDVKPRGMMFERSGQILIAAGEQLLRVTPSKFTVEASIPLASFRLVADDSERVLAVLGWFMGRKDEFGVHLLNLPSLEPIRIFLIPGYQAVTAALSPNGGLLAFEAQEIGKHRRIIAVFNAATGQELARKKSTFTHDLLFLRDNRTLAIADGRFTKSEAIDLWTVPNT